MNRIVSLLVLVVPLFLTDPVLCQTGSPGDEYEALRVRLASPYQAERELAVKELHTLFAANRNARPWESWCRDSDSLVRLGVVQALGRGGLGNGVLPAVFQVLSMEPLRQRRIELFRIACAISCDTASPLVVPDAAGEKELERGALLHVTERMAALADGATQSTSWRALGSFASLGAPGQRALKRFLLSEGLSDRAFALGVSALARCGGESFVVQKTGELAHWVHRILEDGEEIRRIHLLFGLAYAGVVSDASVRRVAEFVLHDAYSADSLQAGFFFLYNLPGQVLKRHEALMSRVLKEYLDPAYGQKVRFNAALLLERCEVAPHIRQAWAMVQEAPDFASYWALALLFKSLKGLPPEEAATWYRRWQEWVVKEESCAPQLVGLCIWWRLQNGEALPDTWSRAVLSRRILSSMREVHAETEDPDDYALRSGLQILAHLGDAAVVEEVKRALRHRSEAVRLAAGMAAAVLKDADCEKELRRGLQDKEEYGAFGAALGLMSSAPREAARWFAEYLTQGQAALLPSVLANLRRVMKKTLNPSQPATRSAWVSRGKLWLKFLKSSTTRPSKQPSRK